MPVSSQPVTKPSARRLALGVLACGLAVACGGHPTASPSPVAVPPPPAAIAVPGTAQRSGVRITVPGQSADYVEALLFGGPPNDNPHLLEAWEGGPFKHCIGQGIDAAIVGQAAAVISEVTGIPQRTDGPCNVMWAIESDFNGTSYCRNMHPNGNDGPIVGAHIGIKPQRGQIEYSALHELGHAVGLGHSPRSEDLMFGGDRQGDGQRTSDFSASERSVLAAVYR